MNENPAVYQGRVVSKKHFRVFIYGATGDKKLVESWEDYERHMATGIWFSSLSDIQTAYDGIYQEESIDVLVSPQKEVADKNDAVKSVFNPQTKKRKNQSILID